MTNPREELASAIKAQQNEEDARKQIQEALQPVLNLKG